MVALRNLVLAFALLFAGLVAADAANRFGVCAVTCTWDASSTAMWSASTGGATGASVPTSADSVTFDAATCVGGVTCTITVNTNFSVLQITMGTCTASTAGCILDFSANNNSPTIGGGGWSNSGTGTRTLNCGSGTFNFPSSSFVQSTSTGLTFNCGSATFSFTGTGAGATGALTMGGGGQTIGTLSIGANTGGGAFSLNPNTAITVGTLNISAPQYIAQNNGTTLTVTNAINISGSSSNQIGFASSSVNNAATISSANNGTYTWASFRDMTFTGGGTFTATNAFNNGHNPGITITAPASGGGGGRCIGC